MTAAVAPDEEREILDAIERWTETRTAPGGAQVSTMPTISARDRRADEGAGPVRRHDRPPNTAGSGCPPSTYAKIVDEIAAVWMAPTGIFNSHLIMAACVERFGTEAQKQRLPAALRQRRIARRPRPDRTRRRHRPAGDPHHARGATATTTSSTAPRPGSPTASTARCFALLVKTDPEAEPRHKGMSMFICEKGDGLPRRKKLEKLATRRIDSAELVFEDYRVPAPTTDRRRRRAGLQAGRWRAGARPHQRGGARRRHRRQAR